MTDEVLELARNQCVELKKTENNTFHNNVDAYEIIYVHDSFLPSLKKVLKRAWFIKGNRLYIYWRMKRSD